MSKKQEGYVEKYKSNNDYLSFLKEITNILKTDKNFDNDLQRLLSEKPITKSMLFERIISYCYDSPHLIWYINKYMNNIFSFNYIDEEDFICTIKFILHNKDIIKDRRLYFLKSNENKIYTTSKVKQLLKNYNKIVHNRIISDLELNYFVYLYEKNIIKYDELLLINKQIYNNDDLNIERYDVGDGFNDISESSEEVKEKIKKQSSQPFNEELTQFIEKLKNNKINDDDCKQCKLYNNTMIPFDTNLESLKENVDIIFIGTFPYSKDAVYNKACLSDDYMYLREQLYPISEYKWAYVNCMSCVCENDKILGKTNKKVAEEFKVCQKYLKYLIKQFNPKYFVLIGSKVTEFFGYKDPISKICGQVSENNNKYFIPLISPSSVVNYTGGKLDNSFKHGISKIIELVKREDRNDENIKNVKSQEKIKNTNNISSHQNINYGSKIDKIKKRFNVNEDDYVDEVTSDLTFFDSTTLTSNIILKIYIDSEGKQKYKLEEIDIPIYIRNRDWKDCEMVETNFDYKVKITSTNEKYELTKTLRNNLESSKQETLQGDT